MLVPSTGTGSQTWVSRYGSSQGDGAREPQDRGKITCWEKAGGPLKETKGHAGLVKGEAELEITSGPF